MLAAAWGQWLLQAQLLHSTSPTARYKRSLLTLRSAVLTDWRTVGRNVLMGCVASTVLLGMFVPYKFWLPYRMHNVVPVWDLQAFSLFGFISEPDVLLLTWGCSMLKIIVANPYNTVYWGLLFCLYLYPDPEALLLCVTVKGKWLLMLPSMPCCNNTLQHHLPLTSNNSHFGKHCSHRKLAHTTNHL